MRITARLIIRYNSARGWNWRRGTHRANVTTRHKIKTVEKFGKDSPTVFIYRFSGILASSYPRWFIKRSSENVSKSIENFNARSMDTRQSLKAFYASIRYGFPVIHSSLLHLSFMFLFNWWRKITDFLEDQQISLEKSRYETNCEAHSAKMQVHILFSLPFYWESSKYRSWTLIPIYNVTLIKRTFIISIDLSVIIWAETYDKIHLQPKSN